MAVPSLVWLSFIIANDCFLLTDGIVIQKDKRILFMGKNNTEVIFQTRSPVDRRRVEDKRLSLKQEYLDHNPERRVNKIKRRMTGDRRRMLFDVIYNFWKETP